MGFYCTQLFIYHLPIILIWLIYWRTGCEIASIHPFIHLRQQILCKKLYCKASWWPPVWEMAVHLLLLVMYLVVSCFVMSFSPWDVLDEIWDWIESVPEEFSYLHSLAPPLQFSSNQKLQNILLRTCPSLCCVGVKTILMWSQQHV